MKKLYFISCLFLVVFSAKSQWVADTMVRNVICNLPGTQTSPRICTDGHKGAIMCWTDYSTTHSRIYAQHIDSAGYIQWAVNGIPVSDTMLTVGAYAPEIAVDSAGGAIIVYETYEAADRIFAVRVDAAGTMVWPAPVAIDVAGDARSPGLSIDEKGGAIIFWHRYVNGGGLHVFVQWIDKNGSVHLPVNGLQITGNNTFAHYHCHAAYAGDSSAYATYQDNDTLRLVKFDSTGHVPWANPVTLSNTFSANEGEYFIRGHSAGNHNAYVFWNDIRTVSPGLYAQRINESGTQIWTAGGMAVDTPLASVSYISAASDSMGGDYLTYGSNPVRIQRITSAGQLKFTSPVQVCSSGNSTAAYIKGDGRTGAIVAWQDRRGDEGVYAEHIDSLGNLLWRSCGAPVYTANNAGTNNDMHLVSNADGTGIAVFLYQQSDVYCAKVENITSVGIDELNADNVMEVFPNPVSQKLYLKLNSNMAVSSVSVFTILGNKVYNGTFSSSKLGEVSIDMERLSAGVYIVQVDGDGTSIRAKFVKQ